MLFFGGVVVFFSCLFNECVFELGDLEYGVFFYFLIEGLWGDVDSFMCICVLDGKIMLVELKNYVFLFVCDYLM